MSARLTYNRTLSAGARFLSDILSGLAANDRTFEILSGQCPRFSTNNASRTHGLQSQ